MTNSDEILLAISQTLNRIERLQEQNNEILEKNTQVLQANTDYLGNISEQLTSLENKIETRFEQVTRNFENLEVLIRQMYEVTQAQSGHIDRLMAITETLIQQRIA